MALKLSRMEVMRNIMGIDRLMNNIFGLIFPEHELPLGAK